MKSKIIKTIIVAIISVLGLSLSLPVYADDSDICSNEHVSQAIKSASGCDNNTNDNLRSVIINIINIVMGIIALVAVIAIIIGGVQYMTSIGDPGKVKKAKDTILYAVIGLIVVILAAVIVNFVIASLS